MRYKIGYLDDLRFVIEERQTVYDLFEEALKDAKRFGNNSLIIDETCPAFNRGLIYDVCNVYGKRKKIDGYDIWFKIIESIRKQIAQIIYNRKY